MASHVPPGGAPAMAGVLAGDEHEVELRMESIYELIERHTKQLA